MSVELNHTIVYARDRVASAEFLAGILGLETEPVTEPFLPIRLANGVTLDYLQTDGEVCRQHYAFLVGDEEFDAALARVEAAGLTFWADPGHGEPGEINYRFGGRGFYFEDPDGHNMELLTRA
ncbi:VOC family protein [Amycolatopsis sp. NEAU-NG30]|uniref:VOC family protein n=1 Tax=Amycolatopsis melonis TaxID=3156488 RepID=A0ABV0LMR6_9PSEU